MERLQAPGRQDLASSPQLEATLDVQSTELPHPAVPLTASTPVSLLGLFGNIARLLDGGKLRNATNQGKDDKHHLFQFSRPLSLSIIFPRNSFHQHPIAHKLQPSNMEHKEDTPDTRQLLVQLKWKLTQLNQEAARKPKKGWGWIALRSRIRQTIGEIAKLVFPKFTAMDPEQLWGYLNAHLQSSMMNMETVKNMSASNRNRDATKDLLFDVASEIRAAVSDLNELNNVLHYIRQLRAAYDERAPNDIAKEAIL